MNLDLGKDLVTDLLRRSDVYGPWRKEGAIWRIGVDRKSSYEIDTSHGTPAQWFRELRGRRWANPEVLGYLVRALLDWGVM